MMEFLSRIGLPSIGTRSNNNLNGINSTVSDETDLQIAFEKPVTVHSSSSSQQQFSQKQSIKPRPPSVPALKLQGTLKRKHIDNDENKENNVVNKEAKAPKIAKIEKEKFTLPKPLPRVRDFL